MGLSGQVWERKWKCYLGGPMPSYAWPGSGQGDDAEQHVGTFKCPPPAPLSQGLLNNLVGKSLPQNHGDWISCQLEGGVGGGLK